MILLLNQIRFKHVSILRPTLLLAVLVRALENQ